MTDLAVQGRENEECQDSGGDQASDDDGRERPLDLGSHRRGQRHGQKAEASDECRHQHGPEPVHRSLYDSLISGDAFCFE